MARFVVAVSLFSSFSVIVDAGHCYGIAGEAACIGNYQGSPCAFCNGRCQMASDGCVVEIPQEDLPGAPFFEDFSHLLTTNPTQRNYGISVTDIDADGHFDFVVAGYGAANQAFKWEASKGSFEDVAMGNSVLQDSTGQAIGVAACDIDDDGFEELYILNTDQYQGQTQTSDKLVDRDASGTYTDLFTEPQNQGQANYVAGRSCACVDRLGAGHYGVFVANYGGPMRLFEMDNARKILDVASDVGMDKTTGGRALIAGPIVTNRMDVFANNEGYYGYRRLFEDSALNSTNTLQAKPRRLGHRKNFMFANDGSGSFADIATDIGLLDASQTGRGTAIVDSNGDGMLDIVYGNWNGPHRLFIQEKDGNNCSKFVDRAPEAMTAATPIRTVIVADFDNDGYEEIFWNNIPGANKLFRKLPSDADWTQVQIGDALERDGYGTGAAVGDFDGDGRLELVVAHGESARQPLSYFKPIGGMENHWIRVLPLTGHGAPARGAKVSLRAGDRTQVRVIDAGSGYLCQMEPVAHFGLGSFTTVESITVTWPDGASHTLANPIADQILRVPRPEGLVPAPLRGYCDPIPPPTPASNQPEHKPEPEATPAPTLEPIATPVPILESSQLEPEPEPPATPTPILASSQLEPVLKPELEPLATPAPTPTSSQPEPEPEPEPEPKLEPKLEPEPELDPKLELEPEPEPAKLELTPAPTPISSLPEHELERQATADACVAKTSKFVQFCQKKCSKPGKICNKSCKSKCTAGCECDAKVGQKGTKVRKGKSKRTKARKSKKGKSASRRLDDITTLV